MQGKKILFGGLRHNIEIGGVASTIPDIATLATTFDVAETIIKNFEIDGSDIKFFLTEPINLKDTKSLFSDDSNITFFKDEYEMITRFGFRSFQNTPNLTEAIFSGLIEVEHTFMQGSGVEKFTANNLRTVAHSFLSECNSLTDLSIIAIRGLLQNCIFQCDLQTLNIPSCLSIIGWSASSTTTTALKQNTRLSYLDISACTQICDETINSTMLNGVADGIEIVANAALETSNAGGINATLQYAIDNKNANITFV